MIPEIKRRINKMTNYDFVNDTSRLFLANFNSEMKNFAKTYKHGNIGIGLHSEYSFNKWYKEIAYYSYDTLIAVFRAVWDENFKPLEREFLITSEYYSRTTQNHLRIILKVFNFYNRYRYCTLKNKLLHIPYPEIEDEFGFYVIYRR